MSYRIQAQAVMGGAVRQLGRLAAEALEAHAFGDAAYIANLAQSMAPLIEELDPPERQVERQGAEQKPSSAARTERLSAPQPRTFKPAKKQVTGAYPRFEREGDKLIKVGWSKKARKEYEHRAPRSAALVFAQHIEARTTVGTTFAVEDVLPVADSRGQELPSYQVYLALAWLRSTGLVEKRGRDGYVRTADQLDGSTFDTLWDQIPERT